ncbi:hypothetical protein ACLIA0_09750 [Bacillaceae bacterium W0354]
MACGKNELTLAPSEVKLYLNTINEQSLTTEELAKQTKKPLFKAKSALRELTETNYIEKRNEHYFLLEKGKNLLND